MKHSQRFIVRYNNHKEPNSPGPLTLKPYLTAIAADVTDAVTDALLLMLRSSLLQILSISLPFNGTTNPVLNVQTSKG